MPQNSAIDATTTTMKATSRVNARERLLDVANLITRT
jgi:hypothetical protein